MMIFCKGRSVSFSAALASTTKRVVRTQRGIDTLSHAFLCSVPFVCLHISRHQLAAFKSRVHSRDWASPPLSPRRSVFDWRLQVARAYFAGHIGRLADDLDHPPHEENSESNNAQKHDGDQRDNGKKRVVDLCFNA